MTELWLPPLAGLTLIAGIGYGVWQYRAVKKAKERDEHSKLAEHHDNSRA